MPSRGPDHGFTAVDQQPDPDAWVACLDRLHQEPFYGAYKRRVKELLRAERGGRYLDVGSGTGDDARELAASADCTVVALDHSVTMASVCRNRGGAIPVAGDAAALPFADDVFDGCRADRIFQHLSDPSRAVAEAVRVVRVGGGIVVVDPDYDTQVMEFPDQNLARRVLRFRADQLLRNGTIAHRMPALFADAGVRDASIEAMTLIVRDPMSVDKVMGLRGWAAAARAAGHLTSEDVSRWERMFDQTVASRRFLYTLTFFITCGTKAAR